MITNLHLRSVITKTEFVYPEFGHIRLSILIYNDLVLAMDWRAETLWLFHNLVVWECIWDLRNDLGL